MNLKRLFATAAFVAFVPSIALAAITPKNLLAPNQIQATLIDEGIYERVGEEKTIDAPDMAAGKRSEHDGIRLVRATSSLPAQKGITFGFRYKLKAPLDGVLAGFELMILHPPMRGVDNKIHTSQSAPIEIDFYKGESDHDILYVLSEDFEVLPGEWVLQVRYLGSVLISRKFNLVKP
jgi:hypothetical protein